MPEELLEEIEQTHALLMAARIAQETLFSKLGLTLGESTRISNFILTALPASRSVPAIVSVAIAAAAVVAA